MSSRQTPFAQDVPIHHQIHALISAEIRDGLYLGRDDFPGEVDLAERFSVSVITSRAVLRRLVSDGLITRGRGHRPRVIFTPEIKNIIPRRESLETYTYEVLAINEAIAPWQACQAFDLPPGSVLWQCLRLRRLDGKLHSVTLSVQPLEIGRRHDVDAIGRVQMPVLLSGSGYPVLRADSVVAVTRPPAEVSVALGTTIWDILLLLTLTQRSRDDQPVEWTRIFYHPDQYHPMETVVREKGS